MNDETIVEDRGITVTKAFDSEGFPVPAVTFRVESDRTDQVTVRIVDEIPADFGIEQIGFHPEYGSEHWTATGEGVVRFERVVDPGEAFTTVYGVKMSDEERPEPFLQAPTMEVDPEEIDDADVEDVVSKESSDVVRELADGERDSIPGLEDETDEPEPATAAVADDDAEIIGTGSADASTPEATEAESPADTAGDDPFGDEHFGDDDNQTTDDEEQDDEISDDEIVEAGGDTFETTQTATAANGETGGEPDDEADDDLVHAGSDASELDSASDEAELDAEPDEDAIDADPEPGIDAEPDPSMVSSGSVEASPEDDGDEHDESAEPVQDAAIDEQTEEGTAIASGGSDTAMRDDSTDATTTEPEPATDVEDSDAEPDAAPTEPPVAAAGSLAATLAEEIRDGTVDDEDLEVIREAVGEPATSDTVRVEHLQSRVSDLEAYTDALEEFLDENGRARAVLTDVESAVDDLSSDLEAVDSRVDSAQGEREALRERINSLADELDALDEVEEKVDRVAGDLEAIEERVADGEEARIEVAELEDELEDLEGDIDDVEDDVEEFKEWRSQLSDLFN